MLGNDLYFLPATKETAPELAMRPAFLSSIANCVDQGCKLGIERCRTIVSEFKRYQVVNFNLSPFFVTLIASREANTGLLMALQNSFNPIIEDLARIIIDQHS